MEREVEVPATIQLVNVFARLCRRDGVPGTRARENRERSDRLLDRCDQRGSIRIGRFVKRVDHVGLKRHRRVFDDSGLKSAGPLPKCLQNLGRIVWRRALGTGLLGEDDSGGRKRTTILAPQHLLTMSAKKNNRPRFGSVGSSEVLWSGVRGKLDKSICAKKWRGVPA